MECVMAKMSGKFSASILFLSFNLFLFTLASATYTRCPPPPPKKPYVPKYPPYVPKYPPYVPKYPPAYPTCPTDALKLRVCANVLGLVNIVVGSQKSKPCCSLIQGLADLEAAVCLCTAIKANILGINLNVPISLSLILNNCGKTLPHGFICP